MLRDFFIGDKMKLIGERIIIRKIKYSDSQAYYEYGKDPEVGPNAGWKPFDSKAVSDKVLAGNIISNNTFAIALKENDLFLGSISLYDYAIRKYNKAKTLGFSLDKRYWSMGYMTEAVKLMVDYCFEKTNCEVLEVGHHVGNYGSKRVIEKCGFNYDGRLCKYKKLFDGKLIDADFYSLTREEWNRRRLK